MLLSIFTILFVAVFIYVSVNKKQIIAQVTKEIETKLSGTLTVGKVELSFLRNFPSASVLLKDVILTDTMYPVHKHAFFKGKEVFATLAVMRLMKKQSPLNGLKINDGAFYLYTDTTGYTNTYLLRGKKKELAVTKSSSNNALQKITLTNVALTINDLRQGKLHDFRIKNLKVDVDDATNATTFASRADILVNSLAFNTRRGSFLKGKNLTGNFSLLIDKKSNQLRFDSIRIKISGQPFNLTGRFDLAGTAPQFLLRVYSQKIEYPFVRTLVPQKISTSLGIVELSKPLDVSASINGPLKRGEPLVYITWVTKNTQMNTPFLDFSNASFSGFFTNEVVPGLPRKDPNSKIVINKFTSTWHDLPITTNKIEILNLTEPELTCDLATNFELTKLNELIGTNSIVLREGTGAIRLNYKGPIVKNNNTNSFLNGDITFKDGNMLYTSRDVEMKNVNATMLFRNSDVIVQSLRTNVLGQTIEMQGQAKNLLTLINTEPDKANIDWSVYSPSLNLGAFTFLLGTRKKVVNPNAQNKGMNATAAKIDRLLEQGRLHVVVKTGKLYYKNFDAANTVADITLLQDRYVINNVSMEHAGGTMNLNGSLINSGGNRHNAKLFVNMNNVDVGRVLRAFDNFGQDGITAQNLDGKLTAKVDASMSMDATGKVLPASVASIVDFSLKEGALNNYEPIKKLQRFVFKNRDFENIRFAELKNRLEVKNREIKINRMEIQSNVLSMFVEGVYSQRGNTDMSIQVPLNNLKKRAFDFNPENIGADKKGGRSIHIRGRPGPDGNISFKLDLFNKYDKEKEKTMK